ADELEKTILAEGPETVAGFIAEPLMGVGGVLPPPVDYFKRVRAILSKHDILMIDDEVICGFWRTGADFGATAFGMAPDTMTLAKAMSSAYAPISAVLIPDKIYDAMIEPSATNGTFGHGFTYGGHPVSCAVALKTLELMERWKIAEHVADVGPYFQRRLRGFADHPFVGDVRGVGLIGGIELVADKKTKKQFDPLGPLGLAVDRACLQEGLIIRPLGDTIAFCPPLIITRAEVDELFRRFERGLRAAAEHFSARNA
ncbi:MAG: aminotransferase class III-fold pyridoxal phosphate-dependent enzyme, partial [Parvularculaceae bacterium]